MRAYNTRIRTFPDAIGAKIFYGAKPKVPFEAPPAAQKRADGQFQHRRAEVKQDSLPSVARRWFALAAAALRRRPSRQQRVAVVDQARISDARAGGGPHSEVCSAVRADRTAVRGGDRQKPRGLAIEDYGYRLGRSGDRSEGQG